MSEAELNAMIDAMAAQVGQAMSPSSSFSPTSQFSPASGSPSSTLPTPIGSRIGSATNPNRTLASGSPTGGDPSLAIGGRISAAAFKRPVSKMPVLPSNPNFTGGDTTSRLSMAPSVHPRALSSPEPRRSTEEVGQVFSQRADTPPTQNTQANHAPLPPSVVTPVQPAEHISPTPPIPTSSEMTVNTLESSPLPPAATTQTTRVPGPPPPFPIPALPAPQMSETEFEMVPTPEYERGELSLKQATDSPRNHGPPVPQEAGRSADVPLPGAGPTRRPGDGVLPDSLLPGGRRDSPAPSISSERGNSRPNSGSFNNIPLSLRPGTPRSASPAQQDFTSAGSLAHTNRDGPKTPGNGPPSAGPPSLMPLDLYSPTLDFGDFGNTKGHGAAGQPQKAQSNAGYGEGKFMANLEDNYK